MVCEISWARIYCGELPGGSMDQLTWLMSRGKRFRLSGKTGFAFNCAVIGNFADRIIFCSV
jgi:hypothetical protein